MKVEIRNLKMNYERISEGFPRMREHIGQRFGKPYPFQRPRQGAPRPVSDPADGLRRTAHFGRCADFRED